MVERRVKVHAAGSNRAGISTNIPFDHWSPSITQWGCISPQAMGWISSVLNTTQTFTCVLFFSSSFSFCRVACLDRLYSPCSDIRWMVQRDVRVPHGEMEAPRGFSFRRLPEKWDADMSREPCLEPIQCVAAWPGPVRSSRNPDCPSPNLHPNVLLLTLLSQT